MKAKILFYLFSFYFFSIFFSCTEKGNHYEVKIQFENAENPHFGFAIDTNKGGIIFDKVNGHTTKEANYSVDIKEEEGVFEITHADYINFAITYKLVYHHFNRYIEPSPMELIRVIVYRNGEEIHAEEKLVGTNIALKKMQFIKFSDKPKE